MAKKNDPWDYTSRNKADEEKEKKRRNEEINRQKYKEQEDGFTGGRGGQAWRSLYGANTLDESLAMPVKGYRTSNIGEMGDLDGVSPADMLAARANVDSSREGYSDFVSKIKQRAAQKIPEVLMAQRMEALQGQVGADPTAAINALGQGGGQIAKAYAGETMGESMGQQGEALQGYSNLMGMDLGQSKIESARDAAERQLELKELQARGASEAGWDRLDLGNRKFVAGQRERDQKYAIEKAKYNEWLAAERAKNVPWYQKVLGGLYRGVSTVMDKQTGGLFSKTAEGVVSLTGQNRVQRLKDKGLM